MREAPGGGAVGVKDVVDVVASVGVADLITGPPRGGRVIATTPAAAYLVFPPPGSVPAPTGDGPPPDRDVTPRVVAVEAPGAVGLPLSLTLATSGPPGLPGSLETSTRARIGGGALTVAGLRFRPARWRDCRPRLAATSRDAVAARVTDAQRLLPPPDGELTARVMLVAAPLAEAAGRGDTTTVLAVAERLVGLGTGSTPSGDDVLAGLVAAGTLLSGAVTDALGPGADWFAPIGVWIAARAWSRTTALSAALLGHAHRGQVATPAAEFLHALTGRHDVADATRRLTRVGHRSGVDLAVGMLLAARAVTTLPSGPVSSSNPVQEDAHA